jgi:hypothetical protein
MDTPTTCAACGGQLKMRLSQWECVQCGEVAGRQTAPQPPACDGPPPFYRPGYVETEGGYQYFSRDSNKVAKRWCVGIYAFLNLLPSIGGAAVMIYFFHLFAASGNPGMPSELDKMSAILTMVIAVSFVFNAVGVVVFYLMLFSDILWLKWLCLVQAALQIPGALVFIFAPEQMMKPEDYKSLQSYGAATAAWIVVLLGFFTLAFGIWLTLVVWRDIRGLLENRRLQRKYA